MSGTRLHFNEELEELLHRLLEMGSAADTMISLAIRALTEQDVTLADKVIEYDDVVDALDLQIEAECIRLIALQQPMARDLRLIGTALKVITDLERSGDHAVDIAKVARKLARDTFYKPLVDLPYMATCVQQMLKDALSALVSHDLELIDKIVSADDAVDTLFHKIRDELYVVMKQNAADVVLASHLLFVAHYLERIADHIVNIAERIYYVETGSLAQLAKSHKQKS